MNARLFSHSPLSRALAAALLTFGACGAHAQPQSQALPEVTVNDGAAAPQAEISGFGDVPLRELPLSATIIDSQQLRSSGKRIGQHRP